jgi:hypothetical protein
VYALFERFTGHWLRHRDGGRVDRRSPASPRFRGDCCQC